MKILVNGEARQVDDRTMLSEIVDSTAPARKGVAVAVNGEVVRRTEWDRRPLTEGDRVEVLAAQQGG